VTINDDRFQVALALHQMGRLADAEQAYAALLREDPDHALACYQLGSLWLEQGRPGPALPLLHRAAQRLPDVSECHRQLGRALLSIPGSLSEAAESLGRSIQLDPTSAQAHNELGFALQRLGRSDQAVAAFRQAVQRQPNYPNAWNNLSTAYRSLGCLDEAIQACLNATRDDPNHWTAWLNLGILWNDAGQIEDAISCFDRCLRLRPRESKPFSRKLFALQYGTGVEPEGLLRAHQEFNARYVDSHRRGQLPKAAQESPIRIGFVSEGFGRHPVGYFLLPLLSHWNRNALHCVLYSDRTKQDEYTQNMQALAGQWHDTQGMNHEQLGQLIRDDRIDILFDLDGHAGSRMPVFAQGPAAVQITWMGYVGTTGLSTMDYLLADRWHVPLEASPHYCERVLRMPDGYVCFQPPEEAPDVGRLPCQENGFVTFGCFNQPAKINRQVIKLWSRIMRLVPDSRIQFRYKGYDQASIENRIASWFAENDIGRSRVQLIGRSTHGQLLGAYREIDLALDPFPYSGGVTTCEALWMGVPVVTCPGRTFAGRHALSHLSNVGLTETVASSLDQYCQVATALATDWPRLSGYRANLRPKMAASPLCNARLFATHWGQIIRQVWNQGL
jgi:predicted O-linked N-acetylglucosamine transferase (SPINDLY family)